MRHLRSVPPPGVSPESTGGGGVMPLAPGELSSLLEKTSRTFALTIPLLDEPLATDVGLAYLLFRIADTLEDAPSWGRDARMVALDSFGEWLVGESSERTWLQTVSDAPPTEDAGCLLLLARADAVRGAVLARGADLATSITLDVVRTSSKMAEFVSRQTDEGGLELVDLPDLREYCYAVAGIVGELLTEMFLARDPSLEPERDALMDLAPAFGEGLQLVNILKDAPSDAREGRLYLPAGVDRAEVVRLARADLVQASEYVAVLGRAGASPNVRAFCELPVRLAEATLDRLEAGAAKLTRTEVMEIFTKVTAQGERST
ncbi:MAG TPA: squalene/phytoene synthase family protein [Labilithrix sp.]|nr:squalene/phytoene synthase family protein [Labilithrix sp.]